MITGCLPDEFDSRDFKAEPLLGASPAVDFENNPLFLPKPPLWNQQSSDSCVAAAWSYYKWQLRNKSYCRKSIFAYIAQQYGAYIRDGGLRVVKYGVETTDETPDPEIRTPETMRDKTGLNEKDALDDRELDSKIVPNNIDDTAKAIRDYKGVVFGVTGHNEGWIDKSNPTPPPPTTMSDKLWGHALYLYGYHLHDGQKCVLARSSWDELDHHIKEEYFSSGNTFSPWTLIPRKDNMIKKFIVQDGSKLGVMLLEGETGIVQFAPDMDSFKKLSEVAKLDTQTKTIAIPE